MRVADAKSAREQLKLAASQAAGSLRRIQYGSLVFCPDCGNLLDSPADEDYINCSVCGSTQSAKLFENIPVVTTSSRNAFPSKLRNKRSLVAGVVADIPEHAMIDETCPECGATEMAYTTAQLRSADEGQTIFFNCLQCGYKFNVNS
ncbi:hypothetical protein GQ42DRAFT_163165 [Ramicandelaber brevisporus]|nr:hypothetical protein GQ42DRAFT_163165 [Ramicandelaber brevisporus]